MTQIKIEEHIGRTDISVQLCEADVEKLVGGYTLHQKVEVNGQMISLTLGPESKVKPEINIVEFMAARAETHPYNYYTTGASAAIKDANRQRVTDMTREQIETALHPVVRVIGLPESKEAVYSFLNSKGLTALFLYTGPLEHCEKVHKAIVSHICDKVITARTYQERSAVIAGMQRGVFYAEGATHPSTEQERDTAHEWGINALYQIHSRSDGTLAIWDSHVWVDGVRQFNAVYCPTTSPQSYLTVAALLHWGVITPSIQQEK